MSDILINFAAGSYADFTAMTFDHTKTTGHSRHHFSLHEKRLLFFVLLMVAFTCRIHANGDPVVRYSSINRVANPEPLSISEIRIVHEQVNITHIDGYNCFDINYQLKNESDKDFPEIHYGFPIDYLVSDERESYKMSEDYISESIYETGWYDSLIKDISFRFNDSELQFHSAKESVRDAGFEVEVYDDGEQGDSIPVDAVNRRWFYTMFSMAPKSEATFNVRYKVYANSDVSLYGDPYDFSQYVRGSNEPNTYVLNHPMLFRHFGSMFTILYDFTPAKHFGDGEAFVLDVDIDLSNLENPCLMLDGFECHAAHLTRNHYVVNPGELSPINLRVNFTSKKDKEHVERKIAPFVISADKYDLHQSLRTVELDFHEPTFVSELVCDLDTAIVKSINSGVTYADGHVEEYRYIQKPSTKWDNKIQSPVILTITDLYHDGMRWDEKILDSNNMTDKLDDPHFKIKKIRLVFEYASSASQTAANCSNIRVLDSRFIK